jgi:hypothetical protein
MGAYHSQPLAPKCAPRKENGGIKYAVSSLQGLRDEMQDAVSKLWNFVRLFDGISYWVYLPVYINAFSCNCGDILIFFVPFFYSSMQLS